MNISNFSHKADFIRRVVIVFLLGDLCVILLDLEFWWGGEIEVGEGNVGG